MTIDPQSSGVRRFARNSASTLVAQMIGQVARFVTIALLARYLSKGYFGDYNYITALVGSFQLLVDFGLNEIAIREIARHKDRVGYYFGGVLVLKGFLMVCTIGILVVVANIVPGGAHVRQGLYLYGISLLISFFATVFFVLFRSFEHMEYEALLILVERFVQVGVLILLISREASFVQLFWANVIAVIVKLILGTWLTITRFKIPRISFDWELYKAYFRKTLPVGIAQILDSLFMRVDIILLGFMATSEKVGIFSGPYRIVDAISFISIALMAAIFPMMSRKAVEGKEALGKLLQDAMKMLFTLALPLTIFFVILARPIVSIVLGNQYEESVPVLQVLSLVIIPGYFRVLYNYAFISIDRQIEFAVISVLVLLMNIIIDVILIPWLGYWGACIGTITAEIARFGLSFWRIYRHVASVRLWESIKRPLIPNLAMGGILFLLYSWSWIGATIAAIATYAILMLWIGLTRGERYLLLMALPETPFKERLLKNHGKSGKMDK